MSRASINKFLCVIVCQIIIAAITEAPSFAENWTYYIDEIDNYSGGDCFKNGGNRDDHTSGLAEIFNTAGWTGTRWFDDNAWPQDFVDSCSAPDYYDDINGDSANFTLFTGHGNFDKLYFGFSQDNGFSQYKRCDITPSKDMRLGYNSGGAGAYFVAMTCCLGNLSHLEWAQKQWVWQIFAFHGLSADDSGMVNSFINQTKNASNVSAWLDNMEDRPGWFTGDNSVIVLSYGINSADAQDTHDNARLLGNVYNNPRVVKPQCPNEPIPWGTGSGNRNQWWNYELRDHGDDGCG